MFAKIGPFRVVNCPGAGIVDERADEVRGEEVRRELDPLEVGADGVGERPDREGLREPGDSLEEDVAVRKEAVRQGLHEVVLTHHALSDLPEELVDEGALGLDPGAYPLHVDGHSGASLWLPP